MAGSSLLVLIDDIATLLDDVSAMAGVAAKKTVVAGKKTAAVLGDDLAVNAEQVTGIRAERELPVVWSVFKGSVVNKLVLVPAALLLSAFVPWIITPLLMLGGAFLCYEGFEKVAHMWSHAPKEEGADKAPQTDAPVDLVEFEKRRVKGAIRTDAILSAEIIVIALGTVQDSSMGTQIAVLSAVAAMVTVTVYGLVAGIVKLDDLGLYLLKQEGKASHAIGGFLLRLAPRLMKSLSVLGTVAMFLVGGGILVHGFPPLAEALHYVEEMAHQVPGLSAVAPMIFNGLVGVVAGAVIVAVESVLKRAFGGKREANVGA